jgi:pimeloyl-ACP methyl ester carboxylesterase
VTDNPLFAVAAAGYCARCAGLGRSGASRRVYMVSRPPTPGRTVRDMAAGYATVLDRIGAEATSCDERVDLLGLSMGGFVAGELAASQPERVGRLVFGLAAARLSDEGRAAVARWQRWAEEERWLPIYRGAIDAVSLGYERRLLQATARAYDALTDGPRRPRAFRAEARACLFYDGTDRLDEIPVPTLVIGADRDPFFSAQGYRATATRLPAGSLRLLSDIGYQAVFEHRRVFDAYIGTHLRDHDTGTGRTGTC